MDYQTALAAVSALPIDEQAQLVAEIQGRLDEEDDFVPTEELNAELDRRLDELNRHPQKGQPWRQVLAEVREELRG